MFHSTARAGATHTRENTSLLAEPERRLLIWLARRLPPGVSSDHLSALGLASMFTAGLSFAAIAWTPWAAAGVVASLAANWFGDSLDGTLARVRGQQRPRYGYYVDHVIDLAGTTALMAGLAGSGLMSPAIAMVLLAAFLLVSAEAYLATHARGRFRMSFLRCGPTEIRILLALGALRATYDPWSSLGAFGSVRLFDLGAVVAIAGMVVAFAVSAVQNTRALYVEEPLPVRRDAAAA